MELSNKDWTLVRQPDIQQVYAYNREMLSDFSPDVFNPAYWECNGAEKCTESGRGSIGRFSVNGQACVLRHYRRGGLIKHFSNDAFLNIRCFSCRAEKESSLLLSLGALGLPVPEPLAFRVRYSGLLCKMDIVLKEIPQSENLVDILKREGIDAATWKKIGKVLRQFHDANVYHADLNAHNILLDKKNKVWLVDFDKSGVIKHSGWCWKARNIARLKRSLQKEQQRAQHFHIKEKDWGLLFSAYLE